MKRYKRRYKQWLTAGLAINVVGLLAGCGNSSMPAVKNSVSSNSVSSSANGSPGSNESIGSNGSSASSTPSPSWSSRVYVTAETYTTKYQNVIYPQLHGLPKARVQSKLNTMLKKSAIFVPTKRYSKPGSYSYMSSYNVAFEQGSIVNVVNSSYFTPAGAGHGMPNHTSIIINVKTGQSYSLTDIFQPKSNYLQKISHVVQQQDTSHALNTFGKFTGVTSTDTMFLREGGFVVDFGPEEWASFAQGFLDYYVPFSSVKSVINVRNSMWVGLHDATGFPVTNYRGAEERKISSLGYTISLRPEYETTVTTSKGSALTAWVGENKKTAPITTGTNVLFFLDGKYLGTDTFGSHGAVKVVYPDGAGTIAVTYFDYSATGDSHPFTIHYHWNGSKLVAKGTFPSGFGVSNG